MRKYCLLFVAAIVAAPLTAQTAAPAPAATRPVARGLLRRAATRAGDSVRFASIRARYHREMETERAALRRTRDRMHRELTRAGWRPRLREGRMARVAAFRAGERAGIRRQRTRALRRAMRSRDRGPLLRRQSRRVRPDSGATNAGQ